MTPLQNVQVGLDFVLKMQYDLKVQYYTIESATYQILSGKHFLVENFAQVLQHDNKDIQEIVNNIEGLQQFLQR